VSALRTVVSTAAMLATMAGGVWLVGQSGHAPARPLGGARLFDEVRERIAAQYVDSLDTDELYRRAIVGLVNELGDPYSGWFPPERFRRLAERTSGNYAGIGARVDTRDGWVTVIAPIPGTPAAEVGLETGDRIVEIDGKGTYGWATEEAVRAIRGPAGSAVRLVVESVVTGRRRELSLRRREIHVAAVGRLVMLRPTVGYVDLNEFSDSAAVELRRAVDSLQRAGARSLVLDLRGNPGGLLEQGVEVTELFVRKGTPVVGLRGRVPAMQQDIAARADGPFQALPVVLLVNGGTASAAEIVAGALQDHDRALVVGTPTFGKGSAQSVFPIDSGALKLTTARWFTPLGRSISRVAAAPDGGAADSADVRIPFTTALGRTVFGGDAIVPDVTMRDTSGDVAARALDSAFTGRAAAFRDALSAAAARLAPRVAAPDFPVDDAMRGALRTELASRGVRVPDDAWAAARPAVDRLLGLEVARYALGDAGWFRRQAAEDPVLQQALALADGVTLSAQLFARARALASSAAPPAAAAAPPAQ
jgi:carboxyl-terminal processing protease